MKIYINDEYQPEASLNASCFSGIEIVNRPIISAQDNLMVMCGGFTLTGLEIVPDGWHEAMALPGLTMKETVR